MTEVKLTDAGEAAIDRVSMAIREEDDRWFSRRNVLLGLDEICRLVDDEREIEVVETAPRGDGDMVMWRLRPNAVARAAIAAMGLDSNSLPPIALHEAFELLAAEFRKPQFMTTTNGPGHDGRRFTLEFTFVGGDVERQRRDNLQDAIRAIAKALGVSR